MFQSFFAQLRVERVPVSIREYLAFLGVTISTAFYYLARTAMVKDERHLDRFDRAFAAAFERAGGDLARTMCSKAVDLPADWLGNWPKST
jgi:uncharacterized protein with von Willebrand factor type A (vWA) domain